MIEPIEIDVTQFIAVIDLAFQYAWATVILLGFAAALYVMASLLIMAFKDNG